MPRRDPNAIAHPGPGEKVRNPRLGLVERARRVRRKRQHRKAVRGIVGAPPGWYPGATIRHGRNAGYAAGRATKQIVAAHYTVGRDSTAIGDKGFFTFLARRNGEIVQFAEVDAVTWAQCEWNRVATSIEVEYHPDYDDTVMTAAQERGLAGLFDWLETQGYPTSPYRDGAHTQAIGNGHTGCTAHYDLQERACDQHYDKWPRDSYDRIMAGGAPAPSPTAPSEEEMNVSDTLVTFTADNLPGEWHYVTAEGDLWHRWGPRSEANREFLCGPNGKQFNRPVTAPVEKVTAQKGVAGTATRLDLFAECEDGKVVHLWRAKNSSPWTAEQVP